MKPTNPVADIIGQALRYDALLEAEKLTGTSYKDDKLTESLGMALHLRHVQTKRKLLEAAGDTRFGMAWPDFKALLPKLGFEIVLTEAFPDEEGRQEEAICAWSAERGALLWAETYHLNYVWDDPAFAAKYPPGINSGKVYFTWRPNDDHEWSLEGASHGPIKGCADYLTRHVDYDIREGLGHFLSLAEEHGQFIKPWPEPSRLWLATYMDNHRAPKNWLGGDYYDKVTGARVAKLPAEVRAAIGRLPTGETEERIPS